MAPTVIPMILIRRLLIPVLAVSVPLLAPITGAAASPSTAARSDDSRLVIGQSVEGRAIVAERFGTPGGPVVLLVALIHGNERGATRVVNALRADLARSSSTADVWLIRNANPDGTLLRSRANARGVDLNRNFPTADWQRTPRGRNYSGPSAASEPETRALAGFISRYRPVLSIWYHQVGPVVDPHPLGDQSLMRRYAEVVRYPLSAAVCRGVCAGTATTFHARTVPGATAFVVELPASVDVTHVDRNLRATRTVIAMLERPVSSR